MNENESCVYVGVDTTSNQSRIADHMKPSKYEEQPINKYMQDNKWYSVELAAVETSYAFLKEIAHILEKEFIAKLQPEFNIYGKKG